MSRSTQKPDPATRRRRYLVHLFCAPAEGSLACRYVANIGLWTVRNRAPAKTQDHAFTDEYELIKTINPLLPPGSDVRDVLGLIESQDGFLYLLYLNSDQAGTLGWRE
jgi:hypothetical protein